MPKVGIPGAQAALFFKRASYYSTAMSLYFFCERLRAANSCICVHSHKKVQLATHYFASGHQLLWLIRFQDCFLNTLHDSWLFKCSSPNCCIQAQALAKKNIKLTWKFVFCGFSRKSHAWNSHLLAFLLSRKNVAVDNVPFSWVRWGAALYGENRKVRVEKNKTNNCKNWFLRHFKRQYRNVKRFRPHDPTGPRLFSWTEQHWMNSF